MLLVRQPSSMSWHYIGCYSQFHWGNFSVCLHKHLHHICWKIKKGNYFPLTYLIFSLQSMEFQMHFIEQNDYHHPLLLQLRMTGLLLAVFALFAIVVFVCMRLLDPDQRQIFVGYLSVASLISMFASPLFIIVRSSQ